MKNSDLDGLVINLQSIISNYRCSFSNQEIDVLKECISLIEEVKKSDGEKSIAFQTNIIKVADILLRVFSNDKVLDFLKELIH